MNPACGAVLKSRTLETCSFNGFGRSWPSYRDTRKPTFQELYARWCEYGAFYPIFARTGIDRMTPTRCFLMNRLPILIQYDKLLYRLLPCIYSLAWRVTNEDYTIQRPLVMAWRTDPKVASIRRPVHVRARDSGESGERRKRHKPLALLCRQPAPGTFLVGREACGRLARYSRCVFGPNSLYVRAGSILLLGHGLNMPSRVWMNLLNSAFSAGGWDRRVV